MRSLIRTALLAGVLAASASSAFAQQGYLSVYAKLPGEAHANRLPNHVYFSEGGSLVDRPDVAFAAGAHTIARLEVGVAGCTAVATNVPFNIVAGQLTKITPVVTLESCYIQAAPASDYNGYGDVKVVRANGQVAFDCHLTRGVNGLVTMDPSASCSLTLSYGEPYTVHITRGNDQISVYAFGCDQEDEEANKYVCNYTADTLSTPDVGAIRLITDIDVAPPDPRADLAVTLTGTVQSGFGTISKFRVKNNGPNVVSATIGAIATEIPGPHDSYARISGGFAAGPCLDRCEFRIAAGESIDWYLRTVPALTEFSNGTFLAPASSRYCQGGYALVYDVASNVSRLEVDPDPTNNTAPCASSDVQVTVAAGTSTPPNQTLAAGAASVAMLQFALDPSSSTTLDNITLTASGSGNEHVDVTAVKLYADANGNGVADAGETLLASGNYGDNDGSVTLTVAPPYAVSGPSNFLVTYDFNTTIASRYGGPIAFASMLPLIFLPGLRRRRRQLAMVLLTCVAMTAVACGGDSTSPNPPPGGSKTYSVKLTGVTASGAEVSDVSVQGAIVTVTP